MVEEAVAEARTTWPSLQLPEGAFIDYLARRVDATAAEPLQDLCLPDLYLAAGCAAGDAAAVRAFETEFAREIEAGLRRVDKAGIHADDLRQSLREKLFTAAPGASAKIEEYAGSGRLRGWVRVTVLRLRIDAERRQKARREVYDERAMGALASEMAADPELAHLKDRYRVAFRDALAVAFRALGPRQRNLLRHKLVEGLGTAQIAGVYGVHRATMKRWLADARETLLHTTREHFLAHAAVDASEFDSVMRLIISGFDMSVGALLRTSSHEVER